MERAVAPVIAARGLTLVVVLRCGNGPPGCAVIEGYHGGDVLRAYVMSDWFRDHLGGYVDSGYRFYFVDVCESLFGNMAAE